MDGPRIALVACGASKLPRRAAAQDLYTGTLFRAARAYAERCCDHWYILSAKHGLVDPETKLNPYDCSLAAFDARERDAWGDRVVDDFVRQWGQIVNVTPVILAGAMYRDAIRGKLVQLPHRRDVSVSWNPPLTPLAHLAIGQQMAWLNAEVSEMRRTEPMPRSMHEVHDLGRHVHAPRPRCVACHTHVCPHCGNRDPKTIQDNGCKPSDPDFTLLCVARVELGQDAFDGKANPPLEVGADGKVSCGMQWSPNEAQS